MPTHLGNSGATPEFRFDGNRSLLSSKCSVQGRKKNRSILVRVSQYTPKDAFFTLTFRIDANWLATDCHTGMN
jgi:hypothetical protein